MPTLPCVRRRLALAAAAASLAIVPSTASAAPDWVSPRLIPDDSATWQGVTAMGVGPDGRATYGQLAITSVTPLQTSLSLLSHLPGDPVAEQFGLGTGDGAAPAGVTVGVGPDGSAAACITEIVGSNPATDPQRRRVTYRPAGSATWEPPATLATDTVKSGTFSECQPTVGPDGTAAVATRQTTADAEPRRTQVFLMVHRPGGVWTAPQAVSAATRTGYGVSTGVDAAGNVTVAWDERYFGESTPAVSSDDRSSLKVAVRAASNGVLGAPTSVTPETTVSAGSPALAVGADGSAVLGFQFNGSGASEYQAWVATRDGANGAWSAPHQIVDNAAASSSVRDVGIAPDGTAYAGYWRQAVASTDNQAGMSRRPAGGSWTGEQGVGPKNLSFADGDIGFLGNDAVFVYGGPIGGGGMDPGLSVLQAVHWPAGAASAEGARDLLPPGTPSQYGRLDTDHQGGLFLTVDRYDMPPYGRTQVIAFDASPPRLAALSVPASGVAGAPVAMSATFADLWSAVSTVTWDFGDGATATGAAASHAYAAPGSFTVTVRGTDALGNARTQTAQITVAAAAAGGPAGDTTRPAVTLTSPACSHKLTKKACKRRRASRARWRTLRGTVRDTGGSGVALVEVAVARKSGKRLYVLQKKRFRKGTTKLFNATFTRAAIKGSAWSLRLPALAAGTYVLRIRAVDRAGNVSTLLTRTLKLR